MENIVASEEVQCQEEVDRIQSHTLDVNAHVLAKLSDHLAKILA